MSCGAIRKSLSPTYNLISSVSNAITRAHVEKSLNIAIPTDYVQVRIGHQRAAMASIDGKRSLDEVNGGPYRLPALRTRVGHRRHLVYRKRFGVNGAHDQQKVSEVERVV